MLNVKRDLIGKTITGIIAAPVFENQAEAEAQGGRASLPSEIWMIQFSDGTHVEFVSPGARQGLRRWAGKGQVMGRPEDPQLLLNVA